MKHILFFLVAFAGFSQEKITDFENLGAKSPSNIQYIDSVNNKLIFYASTPETNSIQSVWTTDGTKENTYFLKTKEGKALDYFSRVVKNYGNLYLLKNGIWRTNGSNLEQIVPYADSLQDLQKVGNKTLLVYQKFFDKDRRSISYFQFLDSLNNITFWQKDILIYKVIDNVLHYIKLNTKTTQLEIHQYSSKEDFLVSIAPKEFNYLDFEFHQSKDVDYYFLNFRAESRLVSIEKKDRKKYTETFWGERKYFDFPNVINDTSRNVYFLKTNGQTLKIFTLSKENSFDEIGLVSFDKLIHNLKNLPTTTGFAGFGGVTFYRGKLVYLTFTAGMISYNGYYLNEYDLKAEKLRSSKSINVMMYPFFKEKITPIDENTYLIDDTKGRKLTYNLLKDTIVGIKSYKYLFPNSNDSVFKMGNRTIVVSDNVYDIIASKKIELISSRPIFMNGNNSFVVKSLGKKLLFWLYNNSLKKTQLWVSNGERSGSQLIYTFDGLIDVYNQERIKIIDTKAYYYFYENNVCYIYETDGTKSGTKKIYQTGLLKIAYLNDVKTNNRQLLYIFRAEDEKILVSIENGQANLITTIPKTEFGFDVYQTTNETFIVTQNRQGNRSYTEIFQLKGENLEFIASDAYNFKIVGNRFYFLKYREKPILDGIYYVDERGKITTITQNRVNDYYFLGDKLVYFSRTQKTDFNMLTYQIHELWTNKEVNSFIHYVSVNDGTQFNIQTVNKILVFNKNNLIILIDGQSKKEILLEHTLYEPPKKFFKGFLIQETIIGNRLQKLSYYDLADQTAAVIINNRSIELQALFNENANFILVQIRDGNTSSWKVWNATTDKLSDLSANNYINVNANGAIFTLREGYDFNYYYSKLEDDKLTQKYKIDNYYGLIKIDNASFGVRYLPSTGNEFVFLGKDSLLTFPEIVGGSEGISLNHVFTFNNQLYTYNFTPTHGNQVWKMGEIGQKEFNFAQITSTEPKSETISLFPNPASEIINVQSHSKLQYQIFDNVGKEVLRGETNDSQTINVSELPQGIYIFRFSDGTKTFSKKIVKF